MHNMHGETSSTTNDIGNESLKRTSLMLMFMTLLSRILGIIRIRVISAFFGASGIADVINFTFSIPNNIRKLLAEGALSSAFIPVFSRTIQSSSSQEKGSAQNLRSSRLLSLIITFQLIILIPSVGISAIYSRQIITFLTDFSERSLIEASAILLLWFGVYVIIVSISAILQAVLHCEGDFFITAFAPLVFSICVISSIYVFATRYSSLSMAFGVVVGGIVQLLILLPVVYMRGYRITLTFSFREPAFIEVLRAWGPVIATSILPVLTQQFAFYLATRLTIGSVTALSNSIIFLQMPYGVFFVSIMTVYFPLMSRTHAANDTRLMRDHIVSGSQYLGVFLIPSSIVLIGFSNELVAVLLQNGLFTYDATLATASVLRYYCLGMLFMGVFGFFQRYLFASHQFRLSLIIISIISLVDVSISLLGLSLWESVNILALANSISLMIGTLIVVLIVSHKYDGKLINQIGGYYGRILVANGPLIVVIILYKLTAPVWWMTGSTVRNITILLVICMCILLITVGMYSFMHIDFLSVLKRRRSSNISAE